MENLKKNVQNKFEQLRETLNLREKLLLRQIDAISSISHPNFVATGTINNSNCGAGAGTGGSGTPGAGSSSVEDIEFITENEESILSYLRSFGKFNLDNINFANDLYVNEDYILPNIDHEIMYKHMPRTGNNNMLVDEFENDEKIIVDFSSNKKLIKDNVNNLNDSIINITLNETKELIKLTKNNSSIPSSFNLNLNNSSITASVTTTTTTNNQMPDQITATSVDEPLYSVDKNDLLKKPNTFTTITTLPHADRARKLQAKDQQNPGKRPVSATTTTITTNHRKPFKPKITINNCNGTINLKNISNLIINCANQESMNIDENVNADDSISDPDDSVAESQDLFSPIAENGNNIEDEDEDEDEITSTTNTTTTTDQTISTKNNENCEFYNRLITEIQNTLKQQTHHRHTHTINKSTTTDNIPIEYAMNSSSNSLNNNNNINDSKNRKFMIRNFENLKIVLESTNNLQHNNNNNNNVDNQSQAQHPVQIEQWLAQIISEPEIEPIQNTELFETKNAQNRNILIDND